jgi:hypothetical protein
MTSEEIEMLVHKSLEERGMLNYVPRSKDDQESYNLGILDAGGVVDPIIRERYRDINDRYSLCFQANDSRWTALVEDLQSGDPESCITIYDDNDIPAEENFKLALDYCRSIYGELHRVADSPVFFKKE